MGSKAIEELRAKSWEPPAEFQRKYAVKRILHLTAAERIVGELEAQLEQWRKRAEDAEGRIANALA